MTRPPRTEIAAGLHSVLDTVEHELRATALMLDRTRRDLTADLAALRHLNRIEGVA